MNTLLHDLHDGYLATVELDEEAGLFHGEVINTRDVLTFQGLTGFKKKRLCHTRCGCNGSSTHRTLTDQQPRE